MPNGVNAIRSKLCVAALVLGVLSLAVAFVPIVGMIAQVVLLPSSLLLSVVALGRVILSHGRLKGGHLVFFALAAMIGTLGVVRWRWVAGGHCQMLMVTDRVALVNDLKAQCGNGCCNGVVGELIKTRPYFDAAEKSLAKRTVRVEGNRHGSGSSQCDGFTVRFGMIWPCHDNETSWKSTSPKTWSCWECTEHEKTTLNAKGYRVEVSSTNGIR